MLGGVRLAPWGLFGATILAALFWLACNGNGGGQGSTAVPGPTASALCQPLADAESFRYEFGYEMESLKPEGPIDTSAVGDPPCQGMCHSLFSTAYAIRVLSGDHAGCEAWWV